MKVWGVSEADIREAAAEVGLVIFNDRWTNNGVRPVGRALDFRLGIDVAQPRNEAGLVPFQRLGYHGRRLPYVCWHGHKRFMLALFERNPEARIKSALADYRGREHFLSTHKKTIGEGNQWNLAYGQRCGCGRNADIPRERR